MEGWKYWIERKVFVILKNSRKYSGSVIGIEESKNAKILWIILLDKFGNRVTFSTDEIETIEEEIN